jgi:Uma2 family endonuclease
MPITAQALYQRHRLTVDDYHRMGEAGILQEDDRVELIEGEIVDMPPIGSKHAAMVARLQRLLERATGEQAIVWTQNPIVLDNLSEPQPDLCLLRPEDSFYESSHPRPKDVLLVIEIADTTLHYDREVKVPLYVRHGIPEVWIVNVENHCLHTFRNSARDSYQDCQTLSQMGVIIPIMLPQCAINLAGLFRSSH